MAEIIDSIVNTLDQATLKRQREDINGLLEKCTAQSSRFAESKNTEIDKLLLEVEHVTDFRKKADKLLNIHKLVFSLLEENEIAGTDQIRKSYTKFADTTKKFSLFFYAFDLIKQGIIDTNPINRMKLLSAGFQRLGEALWEDTWLLSPTSELALTTLCKNLLFSDIERISYTKKNKKDIELFRQYKIMLRQSLGFILWRIDEHEKEQIEKEALEKSIKLIDSWMDTNSIEEEGTEECLKRIDEGRYRKLFEEISNNP
jgi:hypothetical protein